MFFHHEFLQIRKFVTKHTTAEEIETQRQLQIKLDEATEEWRITWADTANVRRIMKSGLENKEARAEAQYKYRTMRPAELLFRRKKGAARRALDKYQWKMLYAALRRKAKVQLAEKRRASRMGDGQLEKIVNDIERRSYKSLMEYLEAATTEEEDVSAEMLLYHLYWAEVPGADGFKPPSPKGVSPGNVLRHLRVQERLALGDKAALTEYYSEIELAEMAEEKEKEMARKRKEI